MVLIKERLGSIAVLFCNANRTLVGTSRGREKPGRGKQEDGLLYPNISILLDY